MVKNKKINTTERVKGNMKPSSSSFAADLLTKEIGFNTGFSLNINFNTFTSEDKEKTNAMAIESANLDQELIVNLKKLSKRNSVTKVKALQDIYNKIVTIKEEEMEIFLNVYVPQFQKFVFDLERKVRSLNLLIFQTIVDKINRKIRPHLKQLLPSWLAAFFDNKEQAELAKKLFENLFPSEKQEDVLKFGQEEILEFVTNYLIYQSRESISDNRFYSNEEMDQRYSKIISACFRILNYLMNNLSLEKRASKIEKYEEIFDNEKYFMYFKHDDYYIRRASYELILGICLNQKELIEKRLENYSKYFLTVCFNETDHFNHQLLFEALIVLTKKFPIIWSLQKKPSINKLIRFINEGCGNNTLVVFNYLDLLINEMELIQFNEKNIKLLIQAIQNDIHLMKQTIKNQQLIIVERIQLTIKIYNILLKKIGLNTSNNSNSNNNNELLNLIQQNWYKLLTTGDKNINNNNDIDITPCLSIYAQFINNLIIYYKNQNQYDNFENVFLELEERCQQIIFYNQLNEINLNELQIIILLKELIYYTQEKEKFIQLAEQLFLDAFNQLDDNNNEENNNNNNNNNNETLIVLFNFYCNCYLILFDQFTEDTKESITPINELILNQMIYYNVELGLNTLLNENNSFNKQNNQIVIKLMEIMKLSTDKINYGFKIQLLSLLIEKMKKGEFSIESFSSIEFWVLNLFQTIIINQDFYYINKDNLTINNDLPINQLLQIILIAPEMVFSNEFYKQLFNCLGNYWDLFLEKLRVDKYENEELTVKVIEEEINNRREGEDKEEENKENEDKEEESESEEEENEEEKNNLQKNQDKIQKIEWNKQEHDELYSYKLISIIKIIINGIKKVMNEKENTKYIKRILNYNETIISKLILFKFKKMEFKFQYQSLLYNNLLIEIDELYKVIIQILNTIDNEIAMNLIKNLIMEINIEIIKDFKNELNNDLLTKLINQLLNLMKKNQWNINQINQIIEITFFDQYHWNTINNYIKQLEFNSNYINNNYPICLILEKNKNNNNILDNNNDDNLILNEIIFNKLLLYYFNVIKEIDIELLTQLNNKQQLISNYLTISLIQSIQYYFNKEYDRNDLNYFNQLENNGLFLNIIEYLNIKEWDLKNIMELLQSLLEIQNEFNIVSIIIVWEYYLIENYNKNNMVDNMKYLLNEVQNEILKNILLQVIIKNYSMNVNLNEFNLKYQIDLINQLISIQSQQMYNILINNNNNENENEKKNSIQFELFLLNNLNLNLLPINYQVQLANWILNLIYLIDKKDINNNNQLLISIGILFNIFDKLINIILLQPINLNFIDKTIQLIIILLKIKEEEEIILFVKEKGILILNTFYFNFKNKILNPSINHLLKTKFDELQNLILKVYLNECELSTMINNKGNELELFKRNYYNELNQLTLNLIDKIKINNENIMNRLFNVYNSNYLELMISSTQLIVLIIENEIEKNELIIQDDSIEEENKVDLIIPINQNIINNIQQVNLNSNLIDNDLIIYSKLLNIYLLIHYFINCSYKLKLHYIDFINNNYPILLDNILNLIINLLNINNQQQTSFDSSKFQIQQIYLNEMNLNYNSINILSSYLFYQLLLLLPSSIRTWYLSLNNQKQSKSLEKYIIQQYSKKMIEFNLNQIEDKIIELEKENCQIKRIKNEILICFNIDEHEITISFVMPDSYPLLNIELVGNRHPVIQEKKWRGWTLNSAAIFVTQNGTLIDSIKLFQKNVNLHFQGVEDCTICYSVIGVLDQCLPNKQCRTCKKKFHPACLFKWFKSSAQSTCPLCRNLF